MNLTKLIPTISWETSRKGNPYIKGGDYHVVVFPSKKKWSYRVSLGSFVVIVYTRGNGWFYRIQHKVTEQRWHPCRLLRTAIDAKAAALQQVEYLGATLNELREPANQMLHDFRHEGWFPVTQRGNVFYPTAWRSQPNGGNQ